jgi:hypothetical protein
MSDLRFFDELGAELERAAHRRLSERPRRVGSLAGRLRLWSWSRGLSALIVAVGAAAAVAVAVIALVALHHGGSPSSHPVAPATTPSRSRFGPPPHEPASIPRGVADDAIANAYNAAWKTDQTCRPTGGPVRGATTDKGTPSAAMLATLPVLRRPATSADKLPARLYFHGQLSPGLGGEVYVHYIRRVRVADGTTFYLVPATKLGRAPLSPAAADHCYRLLVAALRSELPTVPPAERSATLRYGKADFAAARYNLETSSLHEGVFLFNEFATGGGGADGGQTPSTIRQTGMLGEGGGGNPPEPIVMDGIVPAGVATVTLQFPATRHGTKQLPPLNATGDVINNVFVIPIPTLFQRGAWPATAIWRSASGQIVKTVNERPFHP